MINIESIATWPEDILNFLNENHRSFIGWECEGDHVSNPSEYDNLVASFQQILRHYSMRGYHCTRLTEEEITEIKNHGMTLQNTGTLSKRIEKLLTSNLICENVATSLKSNNQSGENSRANMLWFCFFEPRFAGEHGIERFFKSWGGEALYNFHEGELITGAKLREIGVPCVIEALVPLRSMPEFRLPYSQFTRLYLKEKGYSINNETLFEGYIIESLDYKNILGIHQFPNKTFVELTGCDQWDSPITSQFN